MWKPIPLLALLFAAPPAFSQITDIKAERFEKKAKTLAEKDKDYAVLSDDERELLIKAVAAKLAAIDKKNRKRGKYKEKLTKVSINVLLADADLETVKAKHPELKVKEAKGQVLREKEWGDPGSPPQTVEAPPELKIETIPSPDFHSLFQDNDWVLDETSCDAGQLSAMVDQAVEAAGKDGKVQHIAIESSASRYRNTGKAETLSFKELSEKRAEAARDFVIKLFAAKGITVSAADAAIDAAGANGDGTSGPEPGVEKKEDYDKYKFVHVAIYVAKTVESKAPPTLIPGKPADQHSEVITFGLSVDSRCRFLRCLKLPSLKIARRTSKKDWGRTDCPKR